ncbi:MAG: homoserine kinase [Rickettsiaceae bacterium]|jgi:homoserine kinase type II|nr:homoserine kinase [Rickettsiaceae bacterium]
MAVYTQISDSQISTLLEQYNIGKCIDLKAIEQGIQNSNYFLTTETGKYIFTIFEQRLVSDDLSFYLNLMEHLSSKDVPCPVPIKTRSGNNLIQIAGKPCSIVSFLNGKSTKNLRAEHLEELGKNLAKMHIAASDFKMKCENKFSLQGWGTLFNAVKPHADKLKPGLANEIEDQLGYLSVNWPTSLYSGIVHADLFPDNVFFEQDKLVGIIDFYFACNDFLMYDVAICLNAWCFENNKDFNITKARKLLSSYNQVRKISEEELNALPILSSGAALRFLLTRLYDWFNQVEDALVKPKDPLEYLNKLRFHNGIKSHTEYGL